LEIMATINSMENKVSNTIITQQLGKYEQFDYIYIDKVFKLRFYRYNEVKRKLVCISPTRLYDIEHIPGIFLFDVDSKFGFYYELPMTIQIVKKYLLVSEAALYVYEWAISHILKTQPNKAAQSNIAVTTKIVKSMMLKNKLRSIDSDIIFESMLTNCIEIIDIKQYEWEKLCEFQVNQLPFG
jgi:hypothetical protein